MIYLKPICLTVVFTLLTTLQLYGQGQATVTFSLDLQSQLQQKLTPEKVGIRGDWSPMSWERTYPMEDSDGDGIYTATVVFPLKKNRKRLQYKYIYGDNVWELDGGDNRSVVLTAGAKEVLPTDQWNRYRAFTAEELAALRYSPPALEEDFAVFKRAYTALHPGLYRHTDSVQMAAHFANFAKALQTEKSLPELYLLYSQLLAKIKCGHTYCNPWNQGKRVQRAIFYQADKLPFHFDLINGRMIVTENASEASELNNGVEIIAINGEPWSAILEQLLTITYADGSNDGKRMAQLQLDGTAKHELFDIYFPLFFPPEAGQYTLQGKSMISGEAFEVSVPAVSRQARLEILAQRTETPPVRPDDLWNFKVLDKTTAYLQLGTFVTYQMELDWKAFLRDKFALLKSENMQHLIIDIRGNAGGADAVIGAVAAYLIDEPLTITGTPQRFASPGLPADIRPYVSTWDDWFEKAGPKMEPAEGGWYKFKQEKTEKYKIKPKKYNFPGQVYLLTDASNSSATHYMADQFQKNKLATLVGQETGGNLSGMTGGLMYFLRLPNSGIEMDIPIVGSYPTEPQPDRGVLPDVPITVTVEDVIAGKDPVLEATLQLIRDRK